MWMAKSHSGSMLKKGKQEILEYNPGERIILIIGNINILLHQISLVHLLASNRELYMKTNVNPWRTSHGYIQLSPPYKYNFSMQLAIECILNLTIFSYLAYFLSIDPAMAYMPYLCLPLSSSLQLLPLDLYI